MKVLAASGRLYRVLLPNGASGYVSANSVTSAEQTLQHQTAFDIQTIKDTPTEDAPTMEWINPGEEFFILAKYEEYWLVRTQQDRTGWLQIPHVQPSE